MRAARFTEPCISTEGCILSNTGTFTFEGELDPGNNNNFDESYENDARERFEGTNIIVYVVLIITKLKITDYKLING